MDLLVDKRIGQRTYIDRDNHHFADENQILKMIMSRKGDTIDILNNHILGNFKLNVAQRETFKFISKIIVNRDKGSDYPKLPDVIRYIAPKLNRSENCVRGIIKKLSAIGLINMTRDGRVKINDCYNIGLRNIKNIKFIVIELSPETNALNL